MAQVRLRFRCVVSPDDAASHGALARLAGGWRTDLRARRGDHREVARLTRQMLAGRMRLIGTDGWHATLSVGVWGRERPLDREGWAQAWVWARAGGDQGRVTVTMRLRRVSAEVEEAR